MVRNLMMIIGLSLAVAAFGCDSDSNGTGGTGGTGGTAGGGGAGEGGAGGAGEGGAGGAPAAGDACLDQLEIVCDAGWDAAVTKCATEGVGQAGPTAECLVTDTGVSASCAACFGGVSMCILTNCLASGCATDPNGEGCLACRAEFCDDDFDACAGEYVCE